MVKIPTSRPIPVDPSLRMNQLSVQESQTAELNEGASAGIMDVSEFDRVKKSHDSVKFL